MIAKLAIAAAALAGSVGFASPASAHEGWRDRGGVRRFERDRWEQMRRRRWMEEHERRPYVSPYYNGYYAPRYYNY